MIDHVLGRPSVTFRKYQVGLAVAFWSAYLLRGDRHGPPGARRISTFFSKRLTTWQTVVVTLLWLYVSRNFGKIVGLECPEPLANLYTRSYFRATYVSTALDAGFWSAMYIKRKWARDLMSIVCTIYYLICAEQADEKVRKIRAVLTVDHLRVAWNKTLTPYLGFLTRIQRPRFMKYQPRAIRIPRPASSAYEEPVQGWLYFDGPLSALKKHSRVVLFIHGGGWVAMSPRTHDDSLFAWAGKTGLPVLALDYKKAPEFPYPYALNECYDVYSTIFASRGRCLGLSGENVPQIVVSGDSAGGNLAAALTLMILQSGSTDTRRWLGQDMLPSPEGLILIYPALDMNIGNWMTDEQMALIRDRRARDTNRRVLRHKSQDFRKLSPGTPMPSEDEDSDTNSPPKDRKKQMNGVATAAPRAPTEPGAAQQLQQIRTRLATPSLISYVSDRVITPEMMRAMIILYVGPHNRPDFGTEYLLSPVLAPDELLAAFPKTYFLTGERDPLVDDTVIMAGRIRAAKADAWRDRQELGLLSSHESKRGFIERDHVSVTLVEGISHGFIQFAQLFPPAWKYIFKVGTWYEECFAAADRRTAREQHEQRERERHKANGHSNANGGLAPMTGSQGRHHRRTDTASSVDEDRPLEMSPLKLQNKPPSPNGSGQSKGKRKKHRSKDDIDTHLQNDKVNSRNAGVTPGVSRRASFDDSLPPTPYTAGGTGGSMYAKEHPISRRGSEKRNRSFVSLASEDDLLGRRMNGLVKGLTRRDEG